MCACHDSLEHVSDSGFSAAGMDFIIRERRTLSDSSGIRSNSLRRTPSQMAPRDVAAPDAFPLRARSAGGAPDCPPNRAEHGGSYRR